MPLPSVEIQAFARPTVKDGILTQPVTIAGEEHGFSAPVAMWRAMAWEILGKTEPVKQRARTATGRTPIAKPSGGLL